MKVHFFVKSTVKKYFSVKSLKICKEKEVIGYN